MKHQALAIIIPFIKIKFFEKTLISLRDQTNKNFNLYIGDDASSEAPTGLLSCFENQLNLTYKRFEYNLGSESLTSQWKRCIDLTHREKWMMILGDDDYLSPNFVESFFYNIYEIEERKISVVRFASQIVVGNTVNPKLHTYPIIESSTDSFYKRLLGSYRSSLSEYIFKRDMYFKYGFRDFKLAWGADTIAWLEFSEFGDIFSINDSIAYIRISNESISRPGFEEQTKKYVRYKYLNLIITKYLHHFKQEQRIPILLFYEQIARGVNEANGFLFFLQIVKSLWHEKSYFEIIKFCKRYFYYQFENKKKGIDLK